MQKKTKQRRKYAIIRNIHKHDEINMSLNFLKNIYIIGLITNKLDMLTNITKVQFLK